jgi:plasmid stabilization system protein ParE
MSGKVRRRPAARRDLVDIASWIARDDEAVAARFLDAAEADFARAAAVPGIGPPCKFSNPKLAGLRFRPITASANTCSSTGRAAAALPSSGSCTAHGTWSGCWLNEPACRPGIDLTGGRTAIYLTSHRRRAGFRPFHPAHLPGRWAPCGPSRAESATSW